MQKVEASSAFRNLSSFLYISVLSASSRIFSAFIESNFLNAIIIVGGCFATYVLIALIVRRFYHYNNYLTEYNKLLHESYATKDSPTHEETSGSLRSKEDAHDYKYFRELDEYEEKSYTEKSPSKSFKTTTIKEADNLSYTQKKSASDDLKIKGFKVIKRIKQKSFA